MATSFAIVLSEFLPPSLLPQMAAALGVSEGQAGQAVTATAIAGFVAGPSAAILVPRLDRRTFTGSLTLTAAVSNALVAVSENFVLLMAARLLLGAITDWRVVFLALAALAAFPDPRPGQQLPVRHEPRRSPAARRRRRAPASRARPSRG
ncbi:MFS transporter [Microbacterium sp. UCD-TDU]|uniref:MFS transporter n=1 Tax=Microbacterium sp. UCD-TDU TaxID=1247714 RepID=UPI00034636AA|nr:MFS transporter [Microbacterium sp. UCD-TDU]EYT57201.1 hypothetical protein D514_0118240 [Microbacterium sp. UCD-TDU]